MIRLFSLVTLRCNSCLMIVTGRNEGNGDCQCEWHDANDVPQCEDYNERALKVIAEEEDFEGNSAA